MERAYQPLPNVDTQLKLVFNPAAVKRNAFDELREPFLRRSKIAPVAIDIGYSGVKVRSPFGKHIIPAFLVKMTAADELRHVQEDSIQLRDENGHWLVGTAARSIIEQGRRKFQDDGVLYTQKRILSEDYLALFRLGVFFSLLQADMTLPQHYDLRIETGLPQDYMSDRDRLRDVLSGQHEFSVKFGNNPWMPLAFNLTGDQIEVISQPYGTLWSLVVDQHGRVINPKLFTESNVLVYDGGFHTADTYFSKAGGGVGTSKTWDDIAMCEVFRKTIDDIHQETGVSLAVWELQGYMNSRERVGVIKFGRRSVYDFAPQINKHIQALSARALKLLEREYDNLNNVDLLVCTGGTGKAMYSSFRAALPDSLPVILAEKTDGANDYENYDPVFANVVGYYSNLIASLRRSFEDMVAEVATTTQE